MRNIQARHKILSPLEDMEVALVQGCIDCPGWLSEHEESRLRYALSMSRLTEVRTSDGRDIDLDEIISPFRERIAEALSPLLLDRRGVIQRHEIASLLPLVLSLAKEQLQNLKKLTADLLDWQDIENEIRNKVLVLVCGGGGGTGYVYPGAFQAMQEKGIEPSLISGTSIGAIIGAFRAKNSFFDIEAVPKVIEELSWGLLFSTPHSVSRYGLPGTLHLNLGKGIGRHFRRPDGQNMQLKDLPIPLLISITGINLGNAPHEPSWYEHRLDLEFNKSGLSRNRLKWTNSHMKIFWGILSELAQSDALSSVIAGADRISETWDIIDALGFSCAVPGIIQYDPDPDNTRMLTLLDNLFEQKQLRRLTDGGLVNNVPAKAAWHAVQSGRTGRRNSVIVALDAFAPKLKQPLWLPVQRLAKPNVLRNINYAHIVKTFTRTPSPANLVPGTESMESALKWGKEEFSHEIPLLEKLMTPIKHCL